MIFDVAIIGAGIAGAGLAATLDGAGSILLLETEATPDRHATGRSAAFWSKSYGGPAITPLTVASGPWLASNGFLTRVGQMHVGRREDAAEIDAFAARFRGQDVALAPVDPREILPGLRKTWCQALADPSFAHIDVAALHAHYLGVAHIKGAQLICKTALESAAYQSGVWYIETGAGKYQSRTLVNAAGAWADDVARRCGVQPIGIQPYRRTMIDVQLAAKLPPDLPFIIDIKERFYFKVVASDRLWLSPHDETAMPPGDVCPKESDIAHALMLLAAVVDWPIAKVQRSWAGLRSFAPDRLPVYGYDTHAKGFFWCAGQGGFGIQTAPAASRLAAALLLGQAIDPVFTEIDAARYSPARFLLIT